MFNTTSFARFAWEILLHLLVAMSNILRSVAKSSALSTRQMFSFFAQTSASARKKMKRRVIIVITIVPFKFVALFLFLFSSKKSPFCFSRCHFQFPARFCDKLRVISIVVTDDFLEFQRGLTLLASKEEGFGARFRALFRPVLVLFFVFVRVEKIRRIRSLVCRWRRRLVRRTVGIIIISIASITSIREMRRRTRRGGRILGLEHVYIDSRTGNSRHFLL